jgi:hypothetical protein
MDADCILLSRVFAKIVPSGPASKRENADFWHFLLFLQQKTMKPTITDIKKHFWMD